MTDRYFKGLLTGMIVGGILSLVFMPESGRRVADTLRGKMHSIRKRMKTDGLDEVGEGARDFLNSLMEKGKITRKEAQNLKTLLVQELKEEE